MANTVCNYGSHGFWEHSLAQKDVWNGFFAPPQALAQPLFVNTCIIDAQAGIFDNNWACYPDATSLLGFMQYVFLPTVFYRMENRSDAQLATPICSCEEFLEMVEQSCFAHRASLFLLIDQMFALWQAPEQQQAQLLCDFCERLNRFPQQSGLTVFARVFDGVGSVNRQIKDSFWCEELFCEETGFSYKRFDRLCQGFEKDTFSKQLMLKFLSQNIGCLA